MAKLTKTQQKRLVKEILSKSKKLFVHERSFGGTSAGVVSVKDLEAIEKLTSKWMKRIG